eukprot:jgi/Orpsp1_1/1174253/evm.model.c7180000049409.1
MKSNTSINTNSHLNRNVLGTTNSGCGHHPSSYVVSGKKQVKRPPSPSGSGVQLSKRPMTQLNNQYLSDMNKRVHCQPSGYNPSSKYNIPTSSSINPSMNIATSQKNYATELNKKAYSYSLPTSTTVPPPFSSPTYEEHQSQSNEDENPSSSLLNSNSNHHENNSMNDPLNSILLDSLSSNFNVSSLNITDNNSINININDNNNMNNNGNENNENNYGI